MTLKTMQPWDREWGFRHNTTSTYMPHSSRIRSNSTWMRKSVSHTLENWRLNQKSPIVIQSSMRTICLSLTSQQITTGCRSTRSATALKVRKHSVVDLAESLSALQVVTFPTTYHLTRVTPSHYHSLYRKKLMFIRLWWLKETILTGQTHRLALADDERLIKELKRRAKPDKDSSEMIRSI